MEYQIKQWIIIVSLAVLGLFKTPENAITELNHTAQLVDDEHNSLDDEQTTMLTII